MNWRRACMYNKWKPTTALVARWFANINTISFFARRLNVSTYWAPLKRGKQLKGVVVFLSPTDRLEHVIKQKSNFCSMDLKWTFDILANQLLTFLGFSNQRCHSFSIYLLFVKINPKKMNRAHFDCRMGKETHVFPRLVLCKVVSWHIWPACFYNGFHASCFGVSWSQQLAHTVIALVVIMQTL